MKVYEQLPRERKALTAYSLTITRDRFYTMAKGFRVTRTVFRSKFYFRHRDVPKTLNVRPCVRVCVSDSESVHVPRDLTA